MGVLRPLAYPTHTTNEVPSDRVLLIVVNLSETIRDGVPGENVL